MPLSSRLVCLLAGLLGAGGVAAAAAASHGGYGESLKIASEFALIHAVLALLIGGRSARPLTQAAAWTVLIGAGLFCGDLARRAVANAALFPFAAPAGGFLMIAGWPLAGIASALQLRDK